MFFLFGMMDEMKTCERFVLIQSFVVSTPGYDAVNEFSYTFLQHKDNEKVSVKKLSNCQARRTPLLKAVGQKKKKKALI